MEYRDLILDCKFRSELYRIEHDSDRLIHELQCANAINNLLNRAEKAEEQVKEEREHRIDAEQHADSFLKDCEKMEEEIKRLKNDLKNAENCINSIEDDLDRGNDNDWAREHIEDWHNKNRNV